MSTEQTLKITWTTEITEKHEATVRVDDLSQPLRDFIAGGGDPTTLADHFDTSGKWGWPGFWAAYDALGDELASLERTATEAAVTERTATSVTPVTVAAEPEAVAA